MCYVKQSKDKTGRILIMTDKNKDQQKSSEKKKQTEATAHSKAHAAGREASGAQREKTKKADRIADPKAAKGSASDGDTAS
jgi:RNA-splicing ligase RtcB